jgi:hypothetical protein
MEKSNTWAASGLIALGLIIAALLLGRSLERFRKEDRSITVKGFSERNVKSDLVIWAIKVRVVINDLQEGSRSIESSREKVIRFLTGNGIRQEEIIRRDLAVTDRQANEYGPGTAPGDKMRYIIEETLEVRSGNVELVQKVSRMTAELLRVGVALSTKNDWSGGGLQFLFTKLSEIKPAMLTEAIQNAKTAADQFARESQLSLGALKKASQGMFSVQDRDSNTSLQSEAGGYPGTGTTNLYKKVRVVITCDYSIE